MLLCLECAHDVQVFRGNHVHNDPVYCTENNPVIDCQIHGLGSLGQNVPDFDRQSIQMNYLTVLVMKFLAKEKVDNTF